MTDSSWLLCGGCRRMLYGKRFLRAGRVCPECGWHAPLTAPKRLESLLDTGSVRPIEVVMADSDPLEFTDTKPYRDRLAEARSRTGLDEAVLCARGRIGGACATGRPTCCRLVVGHDAQRGFGSGGCELFGGL
jgi:acetyl-CoA carboxylase carboxyl transferase subunit beta